MLARPFKPSNVADPLIPLCESDPALKAAAARAFRNDVLAGRPMADTPPPDRPSRPEKPELVPPGVLPRRRLGSVEGRAALLHAIAHIELNAIDLALDMIARFSNVPEIAENRHTFILDWSSVADDEARHFLLVSERLKDLGFAYGDFPAHDGLWDAAMRTNVDIIARLAVAPLVLEARGLDVTPGMITKLTQAGDAKSADALNTIYDEEIEHVAIGMRWFRHVARWRNQDSQPLFVETVKTYFGPLLKPPFNHAAREKAGLSLNYYKDLIRN